jgi:transcriptional regulator with XRE-family HTH domain
MLQFTLTARVHVAADFNARVALEGHVKEVRGVGDHGPLAQREELLGTRILVLGREIRRRRKAQGLTLDRLGESAGLTSNYIGNIEAGQRDPSLSSMIRLARAFDSPIGELLGMPEMSADSIEAARLLSVLPAEVREPVVNALRALAEVLRGRAPQGFASPTG